MSVFVGLKRHEILFWPKFNKKSQIDTLTGGFILLEELSVFLVFFSEHHKMSISNREQTNVERTF